jgi:hypothetical protein
LIVREKSNLVHLDIDRRCSWMGAEPHRSHCTLATDATGFVGHCCYIFGELQERLSKPAIDPWLHVEVWEPRPATA